MKLHGESGILNCDARYVFKIATDAADLYRVMMKDLYDLKKKGTHNDKDIQALLDLVELSPA